MTAATAVHPTMGVAKRTLVVQEAVLKTQAVLLKVPAEMIREALTKAVPVVEVPKEAAVAPEIPVKAALEAEVPKNPAVAPEIPAAVPKAQAAVRPRVRDNSGTGTGGTQSVETVDPSQNNSGQGTTAGGQVAPGAATTGAAAAGSSSTSAKAKDTASEAKKKAVTLDPNETPGGYNQAMNYNGTKTRLPAATIRH